MNETIDFAPMIRLSSKDKKLRKKLFKSFP